jgi:class 3 adenylate cyclase/tetratricopeptide (TPR) repeat protein
VNDIATAACSACGAQTPAGKKFCIHCGTPRQTACTACGEPLLPGARFCAECGTPVAAVAAPAPPPSPSASAERRLVSVLFVDLVGFTTLSEHRDPEEVRELLSTYFDRCRSLIERYGGTVEKFIGDAVMAVWGTPVAREDDAERSVRAGLALVESVRVLGEEVGIPGLQARAGVLTGNAAVELAADGEGMVLGDTVNTASRLQSIADPGTLLVDDVTRRASEAAIAYEDAGSHDVKGREAPVRAWMALRVVSGVGGARRTAGLEAPFVGRNRELQAIIEAADESAGGRRARHVAIVGDAGLGKSRLVWEYFKYIDGIEQLRYWHQGRCLSYGEGVAYWPLAEMVRTRARILEEDEPVAARQKLRDVIERFVGDERERRLVEPRLAHLLRLEERPDADRADLFSGWRLFLERLSKDAPVSLVFEDLQWADSGLLDFIDYLLEWSADFPIFVLTVGRPELRERRPGWEPVVLAPLASDEIETILEGLAPGLPAELVAEIGHRSEGIPLYAVETIRMLQDRGVLVQEGSRYAVAGEISDLDVPETLHALVASRLDGLSPEERSLLQDASVLGLSFTAPGAAALSGRAEAEVRGVLEGLVAKQVLVRDNDPRSPDRGQYVFLQALLRTVAYGTLSRRARKARHVAAAQHLERTWPGEARDIAEVLASHYLEAIQAEPDADDVAALRASAREKLAAAGRAAASLALGPEADRYFEQAAELAEDDPERAQLFEQAGRALLQSGDRAAAERRLRSAIELHERSGRPSGGPAAVALSDVLLPTGRLDEARELLERFRSSDEPGMYEVLRAEALAALARVEFFAGEPSKAGPLLEEALTTLEQNQAWSGLAAALVTRGGYLITSHRREEGAGVLARALALAEQHDLTAIALRAKFNLAAVLLESDRFADAAREVDDGLAMARERGDRAWERQLITQKVPPLFALGRWDEAVALAGPLLTTDDIDATTSAAFLAPIAAARGDEQLLEQCLSVAARTRESAYVDQRVSAGLAIARGALDRGAADEVREFAGPALRELTSGVELTEEAYALSIEAAVELADAGSMSELVSFVDGLVPARKTPLLHAGRARLLAEQAHDEEAAARFEHEAISLLREVSARPLLARTLIERARRRHDPEALTEARSICIDLGAVRWLARIDALNEVPA